MRFDHLLVIWIVVLSIKWSYSRSNKQTLLEDSHDRNSTNLVHVNEQTQSEVPNNCNGTQHTKDFSDCIGFEAKQQNDQYLSRSKKICSNNENLDYANTNMNIIKRFERMLKTANMESNQYYNLKRSDNSKWNDFLKQTINVTVQLIKFFIDDVFTPILSTEEHKIYTPRFLDEIAEEIDVLENKKDSLFSRNRFKRILIPLLIVLKFFKLKLLIFLPIILGLVSFKKFLGFLAIVIPSVIGLLKLYKPVAQIYPPPVYLPSGVGFPLDHYKGSHGSIHDNGLLQYGSPDYLDQNKHISDNVNYGQKLAYQGYEDYQN